MKNKSYLYIGTISIVLGLFLLGSKFYKDVKDNELTFKAEKQSEIFIRDYSPRYGDEEAKVFLIEFLDPECESCRKFFPHVKRLIKEYKGKVQLIVRYASFHGNSKIAIAALEAARKQNLYWESMEILFERQPLWASHHNPRIDLIFDYLPEVGIDIDRLKIDMRDPEITEIIEQDSRDLKQLGVRATPTFFVNGKAPKGFGYAYLKSLIDEEVKRFYP